MQTSERGAFERQMTLLFSGFNVPATSERFEAYWTGLQRMELIGLARVVETALGERGPEKLPNPKQLWGLMRERTPGATDPSTDKAIEKSRRELAQTDMEDAKRWDIRIHDEPVATKLKLAAALLARYKALYDPGSLVLHEKISHLKDRVRSFQVSAMRAKLPVDYDEWKFALELFGENNTIGEIHRMNVAVLEAV